VAENAGAPAFKVVRGPLSAADAVRLALTESPMLRQAEEELRRSQAEVGSARAMTRLRVSTTGYGTVGSFGNILSSAPGIDPTNIMSVPERRFGDLNLTAMFPLYTGGELRAGVREAEAKSRASEAALRGIRLGVELEVRQRYYRALQAAEIVTAYQEWVTAAEESVRVIRERYEVGKAPLYEVLRSQTDVANATQELTNARNQAEAALVSLKTAMGVDLTSTPALNQGLSGQVSLLPLSDEIVSAEKERPELIAAGILVAAQEQAVRQARAAYRPQLYGMGMQDWQSGAEIDSRNGHTVGVVASLPLLDGGSRRSWVEQQQAELRRLGASQQSVRLSVREQVSTAWLMMQTAQQNVRTSEAALAQAEEDYRIAVLRYETGKAILVERLDSLTALVRARVNSLNARYEPAVAKAQLDRAVGRGL
jgi:outer membrane protein TolC